MKKESNQQTPQEFIDLFKPITLDEALKNTVIFLKDIPELGSGSGSLTKTSETEGQTQVAQVHQGGE